MTEIIIINGNPRSGKDTFVELCRKHFANTHNISSVDNVKLIAQRMGWTGGKTEKDRKFLSDLKIMWDEYNNGCTMGTFRRVEGIYRNMEDFGLNCLIFVHIREPEKIDQFKQLCKENLGMTPKAIFITNERVVTVESNQSDKHVEDYDYDAYFFNNRGLDVFDRVAKDFTKMVMAGEWPN